MAGLIPVFTIHDRLRKAREASGLDQHQLAEAMGVSRATVSNYETGFSSKPRKIVLNVWAMATGVPIQWIETGTAPGSGDDGSPDHEAGASKKLLRLDSNQQPSDYVTGEAHETGGTTEVAPPVVIPLPARPHQPLRRAA